MDAWRTANSSSLYTGPFFAGELSVASESDTATPKGRVSERVPIEVPAGLRQRGAAGVSVQVMDLSTHGFRAATHLQLEEGSDVWLRLPGLEPCHAVVAWTKANYVGCRFERPLHPAVLDMIVRKTQGR